MSTIKEKKNWGLGVNNRADSFHLPSNKAGQTSLREAVNVDVLRGGSLSGRIGFVREKELSSARCLFSIDTHLVYMTSTSIVSLDTATGTQAVLATCSPGATMHAVVHNDELFIIVSDGSGWRFDGANVRKWGVESAEASPTATADDGALQDGAYQYAITYVNAYGEEGGTTIQSIQTGGGITFSDFPSPPTGHLIRLYVSEPNGTTLYLQEEFIWVPNKTVYYSVARSDDIVLETQYKRPPPAGHAVASYNAVILIADGNTLWRSDPFRPHQFDRVAGFFQFPERITNIFGVDVGIYVTADRTYLLTGAETTTPELKTISDIGAVEGSLIRANDTTVIWTTEYGPAVANFQGQVETPSKDTYAPAIFQRAAAGIVRYNGNEIAVTVPQDDVITNRIRYNDVVDSSIISTPTQAAPSGAALGMAFTFIDEVIPA